MKKAMTLCSLMAAAITLSSCASLKPPVRPDYTGSDQVSSAEPAQLLGSWIVTDLNPYPDVDPQSTTIEYLENGTVIGLVIPQGESAAVLGNMQFKLTGQWQLNGDTVVHSDIQMESTGDNNSVGSFISKMMSNQEALAGEANIYELSANRIVMVGTDGNAMEYARQ